MTAAPDRAADLDALLLLEQRLRDEPTLLEDEARRELGLSSPDLSRPFPFSTHLPTWRRGTPAR